VTGHIGSISPGSFSMSLGEKRQLSVIGFYAGETVGVTEGCAYQSSDRVSRPSAATA